MFKKNKIVQLSTAAPNSGTDPSDPIFDYSTA